MTQLRLCLDVVDYELTHVTVLLTVLDKRNDEREGGGRAHFASTARLRMTLPELHTLTRALTTYKGPLEVVTPMMLDPMVQDTEDALCELETDDEAAQAEAAEATADEREAAREADEFEDAGDADGAPLDESGEIELDEELLEPEAIAAAE
jgi:hypothetical protein